MPLEDFPRVRLAHAPTPLEPMDRLSAHLGGPRLLVKRDDCTGLALGGNKARQLEYYLGEALAREADTVLITGAVQSNFIRTAAAAAAKLGLTCEVQLEDRVPGQGRAYHNSGNVLLDRIFGAVIHTYPEGEDEAGADAAMEARAEALRAAGRRPYVIPLGPDHPPLGALGYIDTAREIIDQCRRAGAAPDAVIVPSGSAATHVGTLGGLRLLGDRTPVMGVCVRRDKTAQQARVFKRLSDMAAMLGRPDLAQRPDITVMDDVLAPGYGLFGAAVREAINLAARQEGLLLDPVYSGKTMAGLIHLIRAGFYQAGQTVVFLHTGGAPALFGYEELAT